MSVTEVDQWIMSRTKRIFLVSEPNKRVSWLLERQKPRRVSICPRGSLIPCDVTSKHVNSKQTFTCRNLQRSVSPFHDCRRVRACAGSAEACRWQQRTVKEGRQETSPLNTRFLYFTLQITHELQGSKRFKTLFSARNHHPSAEFSLSRTNKNTFIDATTTNRVIIIINNDKTH